MRKQEISFIVRLAGLFLTSIVILRCKPLSYPSHSVTTSSETKNFIQLPKDSGYELYTTLKNSQSVFTFYAERNFQPFWSKEKSRRDSMISFIQSVRYYGMLPTDYHNEVLSSANFSDSSLLLRNEVLLTDAFLSIGHDLRKGRLDSTVYANDDSLLFQKLDKPTFSSIRNILESQEPDNEQYKLLKRVLNDLINSADSVDKVALLSGKTIESVAVQQQIVTIEINMDRWRNEFDDWGSHYVWINIPSFELTAIEQNKIVLESKIIVGKTETPTPLLTSTIEWITLFPYWTVPRTIAVSEYLPLLQIDTSFLSKSHFSVYNNKGNKIDASCIDWTSYSMNNFPFVLRQAEGEDNALGVIKFVFPNRYSVYLHDTNSPKLFSAHTRAFSHGCVRVEKARELAWWLDEKKRIEDGLASRVHQSIKLNRPIPIYIRYFTCMVNNGSVQFSDDVYGLDSKLFSQLYHREISSN